MPLSLSRKVGQSFYVGTTRIQVYRVGTTRVQLRIDAPDSVRVQREEVAFQQERKSDDR